MRFETKSYLNIGAANTLKYNEDNSNTLSSSYCADNMGKAAVPEQPVNTVKQFTRKQKCV